MAAATVPFLLGIVVSRSCGIGVPVWAIATAVVVLFAGLTCRYSLVATTVSLLLACLCLGGLRHQLACSSVQDDDISQLKTATPRPIRLVGIVATPFVIVAPDDSPMTPVWMHVNRSMCNLRCETAIADKQHIHLSGLSRLIVTGDVVHAQVGDRVEVVGQLVAPRGPTNPGAYDYQQHLRRQGIRTLVDCDHPDAVRVRERAVMYRFGRWRAKLRQECETLLARHLGPRTAPLAVSLLLGNRSQLPVNVRDAFVESGTMHLLAISGLHVGILAALVLLICRLIDLPAVETSVVVLITMATFACITNLRPPVIRASILAVVVAAGWPTYRRVGSVNLVAICILSVLLINPTDLFDTGTQLSFLAVIAIGWAAAFITRASHSVDEEAILSRLLKRRRGIRWSLLRFVVEGYIVTAAIWFVTLPLTAAQFHIAAPVGFLVNVVLIPYVGLVLGLGFCTVAAGLLLPWVVSAPAMLFDLSLRGLLSIVDGASALHVGHVHLAGPPNWWLAGFYGLLVALLIGWFWRPINRWGWTVVWCWVIVGQLASFSIANRSTLRCTVLDVGHGCCVIIELPGGKTLLYDAGMYSGERRGVQVIQPALWELGVREIDGIIVSHADVDHFNAASTLMRTMPVGALFCNRLFLDLSQEPVSALCEAAAEASVPVHFLQAGDRFATNVPSLSVTALHPPNDWQSDEDNANSLVLEIDYCGRSIVLPGDVESDGLEKLLATEHPAVDVLLAPHHGSRLANTAEVNTWARPRTVVVSGGNEQTLNALRSVYSTSERLLTTHTYGAITLEIDTDGELRVETYVVPETSPNTPI